MMSLEQLQQKRNEILQELAGLGAMRKGTICKRFLPWKTKQGNVKRRGPYWYYTFKKNNRTVARLLKEETLPLFQEQIERFRSFGALAGEYVEVSHQMADLEANKAGRKKTLVPNRGGKRARSRGHCRASARRK